MSLIEKNLTAVLERIESSAKSVGRKGSSVVLVAATKTQPVERITEYQRACSILGIKAVCGENYAQELEQKAQEFPEIEWHFIGRLQRNKAAIAVKYSALIHSVGSERLLDAIEAAAQQHAKIQPVLLQVNVSRDPDKEGVLPENLGSLSAAAKSRAHVKTCGYMTILQYDLAADQARLQYRELATSALTSSLPSLGHPTILSMGMSEDFDIAIEEGATMVRVGSAIFGPRNR